MLEINKVKIEDAKLITDIKTKAYNKEINTYLYKENSITRNVKILVYNYNGTKESINNRDMCL